MNRLEPKDIYDQFIIGVTWIGTTQTIVYNKDKLIEHYADEIREDVPHMERSAAMLIALEFFEFNVETGAQGVLSGYPLFVSMDDWAEELTKHEDK